MPEPQQQPSVGTGLPPGFAREPGATNAVPSSEVIRNMAKDYGLNPDITERQIHQESRGNPAAVSPRGAIGLMQLMPPVAEKWGVDPHNPADNLHAGMSEMRELLDRFHGDYPKALAAYNAGAHTVDKYGGVPPYKETQDYVDNIMGDEGVQHNAQPSLPAGFTTAPGEAPAPASPTVASPPTDAGALGAAKDFASEFLNQVNPINAVKGAAQLTAHPVETFKNDANARQQAYDQAEAAFKKGNYSEGAAHLLYSLIPMVGPQLNEAANKLLEGKTAAGLGQSTGMGVAMAAPGLIKETFLPALKANSAARAAARTAGKVDSATTDFVQAFPPSKSAPYELSDVEAGRPHLENQHMQSAIEKASGVKDTLEAHDAAISNIEDHVAKIIAKSPKDVLPVNVLSNVSEELAKSPRGYSFAQAGMKELDDFNLGEPITVDKADAIRRQLNAENQAVLQRNNYKQATARATDPGFAAREVAAKAIRDAEYKLLEDRGTPGIKELRNTEGSLIKTRNAVQAQVYNGDKTVPSTAEPTTMQRVAAGAARVGGRITGSEVAGWPGYVAGREVGDVAANAIGPKAMSRNALAARSFETNISSDINLPEGRIRALPTPEVPKGTQLSLQPQPPEAPTSVPPPAQGKLFNEPITLKSIGTRLKKPFVKNPQAGVFKIGNKEPETTVYHGTSVDPDKISSEGLIPQHGRLYVSTDHEIAQTYGPHVVKAKVPTSSLIEDPEEEEGEHFYIHHEIPSEKILRLDRNVGEPTANAAGGGSLWRNNALPDHDTLVDAMVEKGLDPRHAETRAEELLAAAGGKKGYTNIEQKVAPQLIRHYMEKTDNPGLKFKRSQAELEEGGGPTGEFVHLTPIKNFKSIQQNGLQPSESGTVGAGIYGGEGIDYAASGSFLGNEQLADGSHAAIRVKPAQLKKYGVEDVRGDRQVIRKAIPAKDLEFSTDGKTWKPVKP